MSAELLPEPTEPGRVVLDIGGEVGAAIVVVPASYAGSEIEIRSIDTPWDGRHVAVLERRMPTGPIFAAVFASLHEGSYEVRLRHPPEGSTQSTLGVAVTGGQVVTIDWPLAVSRGGE